jgi:hypothetical protein
MSEERADYKYSMSTRRRRRRIIITRIIIIMDKKEEAEEEQRRSGRRRSRRSRSRRISRTWLQPATLLTRLVYTKNIRNVNNWLQQNDNEQRSCYFSAFFCHNHHQRFSSCCDGLGF